VRWKNTIPDIRDGQMSDLGSLGAGGYCPVTYISESSCRVELVLSSNSHRCDLPFARYSRSNGQNLGLKFRIWGSRDISPPKGEKTCPGPICTIMHNFTLIGATDAEISVTGQREKANLEPCHTTYVANKK